MADEYLCIDYHKEKYIELFHGPVELLSTKTNSIIVLVLCDSSLVESSYCAFRELRVNYEKS